jgi:uncharacterized membrane protein
MAEEVIGTPEEKMAGAPMGGKEITDDDKLWALLSWLLWPIAIIALLIEDRKERPFIKYNAVNSLAYSLIWYVIGTITVGCLWVVGAIYAIYLAIKSYQGEWVEVPFITDFCKNQGWI